MSLGSIAIKRAIIDNAAKTIKIPTTEIAIPLDVTMFSTPIVRLFMVASNIIDNKIYLKQGLDTTNHFATGQEKIDFLVIVNFFSYIEFNINTPYQKIFFLVKLNFKFLAFQININTFLKPVFTIFNNFALTFK